MLIQLTHTLLLFSFPLPLPFCQKHWYKIWIAARAHIQLSYPSSAVLVVYAQKPFWLARYLFLLVLWPCHTGSCEYWIPCMFLPHLLNSHQKKSRENCNHLSTYTLEPIYQFCAIYLPNILLSKMTTLLSCLSLWCLQFLFKLNINVD